MRATSIVAGGRISAFLLVLIASTLWSGASNLSFAFQHANSQCQYGTNVSNPNSGDLRIISTFHSMSIYWKWSGLSPDKTAYVLFKEQGSSQDFRRSLDLIYSTKDNEYRGSIVHLKSGAKYEISLLFDDENIKNVTAATWCEQLPIAEIVYVSQESLQTQPYTIKNVTGSPDGYILYTADPDSSKFLDGENVSNNIIIENSAYVIVRGFTMKNAREDAVLITGKGYTHDIVIEDNVIENWGRVNAISGFGESDLAIRVANGNGVNFERLIIQRNTFRNPRADTNSWSEYREDRRKCRNNPDRPCHPWGPGATFFKETAGNHVIRYNELYSTNGNYFFDGFGGSQDDSFIGAFNRDTDIYGNSLMNIWDDAIEVEGGNANVRVWGNYLDNVRNAFGAASVSTGPLYIFRNVVYRTQADQDSEGATGKFIKSKTKPRKGFGGGHVFVFHNTVYRYNESGGVKNGISGTGTPLVNFVSRNNIIDASRHFLDSSRSELTGTNDFDYDLYQGDFKGIDGQEQHGIEGLPEYDPLRPSGSFALAEGSLGFDDGVPIPNFSDGAVGAPDKGAQERGAPFLEFGVTAYRIYEQKPRSCN